MSATNGHSFRSSLDDFDPFIPPSRDSASDDRVSKLEAQMKKVGTWARDINELVSRGGSYSPKTYDEIKAYEKSRERARRESKAELDEEMSGNVEEFPDIESLTDLLSEPDTETRYRISGLLPADGRVILAAEHKAGKTTLTGNMVRTLADGDHFLGRYAVEPVKGTVVVIDTEMPREMLKRWLRDQRIRNTDRVRVISLRGRTESFILTNRKTREKWAKRLREMNAEVILLDCLNPVLNAHQVEENDNSGVGRVLDSFNALMEESGATEAIIAHHMGHSGERSRGASKLQGWPDAEWKLFVEKDRTTSQPPPNATRFFWAYGRDVDVHEQALKFDPETRRLSMDGDPLSAPVNRKTIRTATLKEKILQTVTENPGIKRGDLCSKTGMHHKQDLHLITELEKEEKIHVITQARAHLHYPGPRPAERGEDQ